MSNLQPVEGTYRIKPELARHFSKLAMSYNFKIIDSRNHSAFIVPVTSNGAEATSRQVAKMCQWVRMNELTLSV